MAKTRNKRRKKHRGTQAGTIEHEPRTRTSQSRRPDSRQDAREEARRRRQERLDRPPSWRSAANRAAVAALLLAVLAVAFLDQTVPAAVTLAAVMLVIYIPLGYLLDSGLYRLRQRRKAAAATAAQRGRGRDGGR